MAASFVTLLKTCAKRKDLCQGSRLHAKICGSGLLEKSTYLGNTLISMYAKCGALARAQRVLDELPIRDVGSWNALIAGYAQHGQGQEGLACFRQMQKQDIPPDAITYACILKACGVTHEADMGRQIHDEIVSKGLLEKDIVLGNALVDMYIKCGLLTKAQQVLEELPVRNVVSWSSLIAGYVKHGQGEEALALFWRMQIEGLFPNAITYACILKACGITQKADTGKKIHDEMASQGLLEKNVILGNALIDMYAKCGLLAKAQEVLEDLPVRDVVSWCALIAGYAERGQGEEALGCFLQMQSEGLSPNAVTYACILKACGIARNPEMGKAIHDKFVGRASFKNNVVVGNALVDMYAKCGALTKAQEVLDKLLGRDVVSWNTLIGGYVQHGQYEEALGCLPRMQSEGLTPDAITYAFSFKACGMTQDLNIGKELHHEINRQGLLERNVVLGTALVDMYARCGVFAKAEKVLDELLVRNVVSWSALIVGYAQYGQGGEALNCFQRMRIEGLSPDVVSWNALIEGYAQQGLYEKALNCFELMQREGTLPDAVTFLSVLNACSHAGLVDEGEVYFESMRKIYGLSPEKEHYTSMVDLLGRARHFDKAMKVIKEMPISNYAPIWYALLGACQKWQNVNLGKLAFEHAVQLDGYNAAAYIVMANIYLAAGMQDKAQIIACMRMRKGAWTRIGCSFWVDGGGSAYQFVGESKPVQIRQFHSNFHKSVLQRRYSSTLHVVLQNVSNDLEKVFRLRHNEYLVKNRNNNLSRKGITKFNQLNSHD